MNQILTLKYREKDSRKKITATFLYPTFLEANPKTLKTPSSHS
jgi:hypothetical protein